MQIIEINEASKPEEELVVGIDFGTTNSLIAISENYQASIIKMEDGKNYLPSIIDWGRGDVIVGECLSDLYIRSIKRLFAKDITEIQGSHLPNAVKNLFCQHNGVTYIDVNGQNHILPQLASSIFTYLKDKAQEYLGKDVNKAVVSVPAYFNDAARGQVMLAAKLAGIEVLRIIAEPTAAAYAYGLNNKTEGAYLVYDLGGGTFDVSVLNMQEGILQVVATGGDSELGGDDIDVIFAEYLKKKYELTLDESLIQFAKKIKHQLTSIDKVDLKFRGKLIAVSVQEFEEIITPLISKTINITKDVLFDLDDLVLDGVILVGGSTRSPIISKKLANELQVEIFNNLDPDTIVAVGAALQAENMTKKSNALLMDVLSLSVGLELHGGIVEKIIMRNTPIPFSITKNYTTQIDNQTGMQFHVLQGEREMVADCRSLAKFELKNIRADKAGRAKIEITFSIDVNGILSVKAQDAQSGEVHNIDVKPNYGVNEEEVNRMVEDAYKNARKDHEGKLLVEAKVDASNLILGINKAISETPDLLNDIERKKMQDVITSLQNTINLDNREDILQKMSFLNDQASSFIQKHLDKGVELHLKGKNINEVKK